MQFQNHAGRFLWRAKAVFNYQEANWGSDATFPRLSPATLRHCGSARAWLIDNQTTTKSEIPGCYMSFIGTCHRWPGWTSYSRFIWGKTQTRATCLCRLKSLPPSSAEDFHIFCINNTQQKAISFFFFFKPSRQKFMIGGEGCDTLKRMSAVSGG